MKLFPFWTHERGYRSLYSGLTHEGNFHAVGLRGLMFYLQCWLKRSVNGFSKTKNYTILVLIICKETICYQNNTNCLQPSNFRLFFGSNTASFHLCSYFIYVWPLMTNITEYEIHMGMKILCTWKHRSSFKWSIQTNLVNGQHLLYR